MGSLKFKLTPNEPVINEENTIESAQKSYLRRFEPYMLNQ